MKTLTEYINSWNQNSLIEEGLITKITNFLGSKGGKIVGNINNFTKEIKGFPEKTKALYNLTFKSITEITDKKEKEAVQNFLNNDLSNCKNGEDIVKAGIRYLDAHPNTKSEFNTGLMSIIGQLANKYKMKEEFSKIEDLLSKQDTKVKQDINTKAEEAVKNPEQQENPKKEEIKPNQDPQAEVIDNGDVKKPEEVKDEIQQNVEQDPLDGLTKMAGLQSKKLKDAITYLVYKDNKDKSTEDFNKMITGLGAILCGAKILGDDDKLHEDILKDWGIESTKILLDEVLKEV